MSKASFGLILVAFLGASATGLAAQDASDAIYDENTLATFRLTVASADWGAIVNDPLGSGDQWKRADMTWTNGTVTETVPGVAVKRSGKLTQGRATQKPPIRISFNEFEFANPAGPGTPGRTWRGVNRIKLDAMNGNVDPALMRDRIAYWIHRQAGSTASRACHARLYVNGAYKGVYTVEEPVKKHFLRYRWGEDGGNLYEASFVEYDWRGWDPALYVDGDFDETAAVRRSYAGDWSDWPWPFRADTHWPGGDYRDLVEVINSLNNFSAGQIRSRLDGQINVDRHLNHVASSLAIGDTDNLVSSGGSFSDGANNHYWYHRASSNRLELIKWDPGASQGLYEPRNGWSMGETPFQLNASRITYWIPADASANSALAAKVRNLVDVILPSARSRVDFIYSQIRDAAHQDTLKEIDVPQGSHQGHRALTNAEFDAAKDWLKDWYTRRIGYLRSRFGLTPPPVSSDDAQFVSQSIPSTMTAGRNYSVTVAMKNIGTTTWTSSGGYRLNSRGSYDNTTWVTNRVPLAAGESVAPGQTKTFSFTMTAPATPTTYLSRWSLANNALGAFGARTPDIDVSVTAATPSAPVITGPAAGTTFTPGQRVTATGTGTNLSWSVNRTPDGLPAFATGTGSSVTFTVPADSTSAHTIDITLTGDGGADLGSHSIVAAPRITSPPAGATFTPGQTVTATATGTNLSWSVNRTPDGLPAFATGTGTSLTFIVAADSTSAHSIEISLTGDGGSDLKSYPIVTSGTDLDADGMADAAESAAGFDPNDSDQDGNGVLDGGDDWDLDGTTNQAELAAGTPAGSPPVAAAGGGDGGGGGCGATGLEGLALVWLVMTFRGGRGLARRSSLGAPPSPSGGWLRRAPSLTLRAAQESGGGRRS